MVSDDYLLSEMQTILVIEDEVDISDLIAFNLQRNDFKVEQAYDGLAGVVAAQRALPSLILLDVMMPGLDGYGVFKELRNDSRTQNIPVIMLTAKGQVEDRIQGLESGADDYITKPFSPKELVLRVKSVLKRTAVKGGSDDFCCGPFRFKKGSLQFFINGQEEDLTSTEFKLMLYLCERVGMTQDRAALLKNVWGYSEDVQSRTLDTHMKRLRKKLGECAHHLETVRAAGYRITVASS